MLHLSIALCPQTEKAYQKQDAVFIARKRVIGKKGKKVSGLQQGLMAARK